MSLDNIQKQIVDLSDGLDMIESQLKWILKESNDKTPECDSPLGVEFVQRFFQLYNDLLKTREKLLSLQVELEFSESEDAAMEMVYQTSVNSLLAKTKKGVFKQFTSVAETGNLPKENS